MLMTIIGVAVAQMAVNPTMSLNSIVTSGYVFASIVSPEWTKTYTFGNLSLRDRT